MTEPRFIRIEQRPWGEFEVVHEDETYWLKILRINPGESTSLQYHEHRREIWIPTRPGLRAIINGQTLDLLPREVYTVEPRVIHRLTNPTNQVLSVIETAEGAPDENDIVRINDKYGR